MNDNDFDTLEHRQYHRDKSGRFAPKGIGRYQNSDGSLTKLGEQRWERDKRDNLAKKKDNRIDTSIADPVRWDIEDTTRTKNFVDKSNELVKQASQMSKKLDKPPKLKKMDLTNMTDQEMRDQINRRNLEKQYNEMFGELEQPQINKGKKALDSTLAVAGTALTVAGTALSVALAIKELKK